MLTNSAGVLMAYGSGLGKRLERRLRRENSFRTWVLTSHTDHTAQSLCWCHRRINKARGREIPTPFVARLYRFSLVLHIRYEAAVTVRCCILEDSYRRLLHKAYEQETQTHNKENGPSRKGRKEKREQFSRSSAILLLLTTNSSWY